MLTWWSYNGECVEQLALCHLDGGLDYATGGQPGHCGRLFLVPSGVDVGPLAAALKLSQAVDGQFAQIELTKLDTLVRTAPEIIGICFTKVEARRWSLVNVDLFILICCI